MMSFYEKRSSLARELAQLCDEDDGEELDFLFIESRWFTPPLPPPPQVGRAFKLGWSTIAGYLSRPSVGPSESEQPDPDKAKRTGGGYSIARYAQNLRRVANLVHVHALAVDVDGGDANVHRCASLLGDYRAIVHETFKSTIETPRCRVLLKLTEPIDARTYEAVHGVVRAHLRKLGLVLDEHAKDAARVSFVPMRRPGASYEFEVTHGAPLDPHAVLAARTEPTSPRSQATASVGASRRERQGALRSAAANIETAKSGERHGLLHAEALTLARARLGLNEAEISAALMPAWISAAGESRRREGEKTIADAVQAGRRHS
jgi:hypothetical protein